MSGDRYHISDQNALYFMTFTVIDWIDVFTRMDYKMEIVNSLNFCIRHKGLTVCAWCLMSNHLHLIIQADEGKRISDIVRDFKKFTAKAIIKLIEQGNESRKSWILNRMEYRGRYLKRIDKYKFWSDDNHAIELLPEQPEIIDQKLDYIHKNPVNALIVEEKEHYVFSSARDYAGIRGLVDICFV